MELEVKHLAPYLPYGLKLQYLVRDKVEKTGIMKSIIHNEDETHPTKVSIEWGDAEHIWMFKPILKPLSDLNEKWVAEHFKYYEDITINERSIILNGKGMIPAYHSFDDLPYTFMQKLFELHIDVFGLIEKGFAVDINTLSVE